MDIIEHPTQRRRSDLPGVSDPILQSLEKYWRTLRHAVRIPARNDIEPSTIDDALPHAFILQRVAPGTARMRVAGQKLHDLLKMDPRGMPVTTLFLPHARDQFKDMLEAAFLEPAIIGLPLISHGNVLRPTIKGTMLLLPLSDHEGKPSRVLGALVTDQEAGSRPRRFTIDTDVRIRHETLGTKLATVPLVPREPIQLKRPNASRPALRLVVNNA
jgi:hypothetical protein